MSSARVVQPQAMAIGWWARRGHFRLRFGSLPRLDGRKTPPAPCGGHRGHRRPGWLLVGGLRRRRLRLRRHRLPWIATRPRDRTRWVWRASFAGRPRGSNRAQPRQQRLFHSCRGRRGVRIWGCAQPGQPAPGAYRRLPSRFGGVHHCRQRWLLGCRRTWQGLCFR